jgi:lysozyme
MNYPINDAGIDLLKASEDFVGRAYPDPVSPLGKALQAKGLWRSMVYRGMEIPKSMASLSGAPWTIGYGFTKGVKQGDVMTRPQADYRLAVELKTEYVDPIKAACRVEPNENQLAAMACLAWNIGINGFKRSTVLKAHNRSDFASAGRAFGLWNKAGGKELAALTTRRHAEAGLYGKPAEESGPVPMPQTVDTESTMKTSTIATAGTATAAVSAVSVASQVAQDVASIRDALGPWLTYAILAAAVIGLATGAYIVIERLRQRKGGWA